MGQRGFARATYIWIAVSLVACDRPATAETPTVEAPARRAQKSRKTRTVAASRVAELQNDDLLIGEFRLDPHPVIDGDTIRVEGIDSSIRLIALDTEERFHGKSDPVAASEDFAAYLQRKRGTSTRPVKAGTPMGERAAEFAKEFFEDVEVVRLERDDPKEVYGFYGRPLAYAMVKKNGRWTLYNVECVRAGMSPYFTKYGYSRRFHNDFMDAEAEAKRHQRGIWDPKAQGYGDYDERIAWWNSRAEFIRAFEHEATGHSSHILLSHYDAADRLEARLGEDVTVLSTVREIRHFKSLVRVSLAMPSRQSFPVIFFDRSVFEKSGVSKYANEPIRVRGRVERYTKGAYSTLQIVANDPDQIVLPELPPIR